MVPWANTLFIVIASFPRGLFYFSSREACICRTKKRDPAVSIKEQFPLFFSTIFNNHPPKLLLSFVSINAIKFKVCMHDGHWWYYLSIHKLFVRVCVCVCVNLKSMWSVVIAIISRCAHCLSILFAITIYVVILGIFCCLHIKFIHRQQWPQENDITTMWLLSTSPPVWNYSEAPWLDNTQVNIFI